MNCRTLGLLFWAVALAVANQAPQFLWYTPDSTLTVGDSLTLRWSTNDPDSSPQGIVHWITTTLQSQPNSETTPFWGADTSWTWKTWQAGTFLFTFWATDGVDTASVTSQYQVLAPPPPNQPPLILDTTDTVRVTLGDSLVLSFAALDSDTPISDFVYTLHAEGAGIQSPGLDTLLQTEHWWMYTPSQIGQIIVTVTVSDGNSEDWHTYYVQVESPSALQSRTGQLHHRLPSLMPPRNLLGQVVQY